MNLVIVVSCWYPIASITLRKDGFSVHAAGSCPVNVPLMTSKLELTWDNKIDFVSLIELKEGQSAYSFSCDNVTGISYDGCLD